MNNPMPPFPRNAQHLFQAFGPEAFERKVERQDEDGNWYDAKTVAVINVRPGVKAYRNKLLFSVAVQRRVMLDGHIPFVTTNHIPSHVVPRDRSKYMPHQGVKECARRRGEKVVRLANGGGVMFVNKYEEKNQ